MSLNLKVLDVDLMASVNAASCDCEDFELLRKDPNTCILRRSSNYTMRVKVSGEWDTITLIFKFGEFVYCILNLKYIYS